MSLGLTLGSGRAQDDDEEEKETLSAPQQELARKFAGVEAWEGIWEASVIGQESRSTGTGYMNSQWEASGRGRFRLERDPGLEWQPKRGNFTWRGPGEATGHGHGVFSEWQTSFGRQVGEEWTQSFGGAVGMRDVEFTLWIDRSFASLHPGIEDGAVPMMTRTGRTLNYDGVTLPINQTWKAPVDVWYLGSGTATDQRRWQQVASGPGVIVFSHEGPSSGRNQKFAISGAGVKQRSKVILYPVYEDLELEVTIKDYEKWRPLGSIAQPKDPGNRLDVRATLKTKSGKQKKLPEVKQLRFELIETSREPGICLNFPLDAKDQDYDLRLATGGTGGEVTGEAQKLDVRDLPKDERDQPYAEATVESYDFGGRAELRVTCELEDGRELLGLLKSEAGEQDLVRLPKMGGPGWVAEVWRKQHDVPNLPDHDDEEEVPGQKHKGDGFTLYEEYRGFVEDGKHLSGDPKRKDFFILNLADVRTRSGIALFERLSKLRVHSRLKDGKEMTQEKRLMNGNHREAPHRVAQHGVVLSHVGMGKGGNTIGIEGADGAKNFRPRYVNWIFVEEPEAGWGLFAAASLGSYGLGQVNQKRLYAAAVAHELLHSVGADHHGEWQMQVRWAYFQGAENPMNPTRVNRFTDSWGPGAWYFKNDAKRGWDSMDRGDTLTLLWEDTGANLLAEKAAAFGAELARQRGQMAEGHYAADVANEFTRFGKGEDFWREYLAHDNAESGFNFRMFVGRYQGTDSGNESCVMRYYFATAHEDRQKSNTFFVLRPGEKQAAIGICRSAEGTGGNASSHRPQSRFGPANSGRGDCFGEICPNDAIPPRSIAIQ